MRIVLVGATELSVMTARSLIERGHEVVLIDQDRQRLEELSDELDCSFLHGDGSKPGILREAGPEHTDLLFCLTGSDHANIIASVLARSLGYKRVIPSIASPEYESICEQLELDETIVPLATISRYLVDMARGVDILELCTVVKGDARFFLFTASRDDAGPVSELGFPEQARAIMVYRDDTFHILDADSRIEAGDQVVVLAHSERLRELRDRWDPHTSGD